jgi:site-specific DNA-adenine methylase
MKNHFFISYAGNKRTEVDKIYEIVEPKLKDITTIIEPFCGTSSFSYYISLKHPKKFNYILNDNNKHLIELYNIAKDDEKFKELIQELNLMSIDIDKIKYDKLIKEDNLKGWIIKNKIYAIRPGLFPNENNKYKISNNFDKLLNAPIINFLRTENIIMKNDDAIDIINTHKDDKKCLIFLDPPYLDSCNDFYLDSKTNVYEYLSINIIKNMKSYVVLCLENNWIIKLLFNGYKSFEYDKLYQCSKKKTTHLIITNK